MWTAIIGVIGTLLGVAVGGGINLLKDQAQFRREKDWQYKQTIRGKLEDICKVIEEINYEYRGLWIEALAFIQLGKKMEVSGIPLPFARLSMLINFYAPDLKIYLALLEELDILFSNALGEAIGAADSGGRHSRTIIKDLTTTHMAIQRVCKVMTNASVDLARKCI